MPRSSAKCDSVVEILKNKISNGEFPVYSKLPSENELCTILGVSRVTVRKALEALKNEGLIESRQGSGSFVSASQIKNLIPIIMSSADDTFRTNEIYKGIQDFFSDKMFNPLLLLSENNPVKEKEIIEEYYSNGFTNMIIIPYSSTTNVEFFHNMMNKNATFAFIDAKPDGINCNYVASCNFDGGYRATKHLIEMGHRKIAFCANTIINNVNTVVERFNGYKFALKENGIQFNPDLVFEEYITSIKDYARRCINNVGDATAIFCTSDAIALSISNLLSNRDKRMAIIGFDNLSFSETSTPSISSIDQNFYQMGRSAAEILYQRMLNPGMPFENQYIPIKLYPRSTTLNTKI